MTDTIRVLCFPDAIAGPAVEIRVPAGSSVAEIVAAIPLRPEHEARRAHFDAWLGGELLTRAKWERIVPMAVAARTGGPVTLAVGFPVRGGGGGGGGTRKVLGTVAAIALIGASFAVGAGAFAPFIAKGTFAAYAASAALAAGASFALQGLAAPTPESGTGSASKKSGFAGANNEFEPGAPLQIVAGTRRVFPRMVGTPWTTSSGKDQFVECIYGLDGPHAVSEPKIGEQSVEGDSNIEWEVASGGTHLSQVTQTIVEKANPIEMSKHDVETDDPEGEDTDTYDILKNQSDPTQSYPKRHRFLTKKGADSFVVNLLCDQGLGTVNNSGSRRAIGIFVRGRFRRKGTTTWTGLPRMFIKSRDQSDILRVSIALEWVASVPSTASGTKWPINADGSFTSKRTNGWAGMVNDPDETVPSAWYTRISGSGGIYYAGVGYAAEEIRFYLAKGTYPQSAEYEVELQRSRGVDAGNFDIDAASTDDYFKHYSASGQARVKVPSDKPYADRLSITSVQSIDNIYPIVDGPTDAVDGPTLIWVRVKNMQLDRVSVLASAFIESWNGAVWVAGQISSNPADWSRWALLGAVTAEPAAEALVDLPVLQDWAEWCPPNGKEVNAILEGQSLREALQLFAMCGHASPDLGSTYGAVIDRLRPDGVTGIVTMREARDFAVRKAFPPTPHAFRVTFEDSAQDYEPREITSYAPGYAATAATGIQEATRFEAVSYPGLVTEEQARRRAELDLHWLVHRMTLHSFTLDMAHLELRRGQVILMESDILGTTAGRGRIKAISVDTGGDITGLLLDEEINPGADDAVTIASVAIRLADGTILQKAATEGVTPDAIDFDTPFAMPQADIHGTGNEDLIVEGAMVILHAAGARPVIVWTIEPGDDLTAVITCVDYAEEEMYREIGSQAALQIVSDIVVAEASQFHAAAALDIESEITVTPNAGLSSALLAIGSTLAVAENASQESSAALEIVTAMSVDEAVSLSSSAALQIGSEMSVAETTTTVSVTDFSEAASGDPPVNWALSDPYFGSATLTTASVVGTVSGKVLRIVPNSGVIPYATWNLPTAESDVEIYARVRQTGTASVGALLGVTARRNTDFSAWIAALQIQSSTLARYGLWETPDGDQQDEIYGLSSAENFTFAMGTWYNVRLRLSGTSIQLKIWPDGDSEPGSWMLDETMTNNLSAGQMGLVTTSRNLECQYFAVALDGETAPTP